MATQKIETGLIADSAVTTAKLADNSVTAAKIAAGSLDDQVKGISSSADAVAITIDSSENVGIGTDSPAYKIDSRVSTSASIVAGLNLDASGNNNGDGSAINFSRAGNILSSIAKISAVKAEVSNNETDLVFSNYAAGSLTEKMRIVGATGNVGIGTDSPNATLAVINGTAPTFDNSTHAGESIFIRSGGSAGSGNVQAVLAFGKADGSSLRSGSAIASIQTDSDTDKIGLGFYTSVSSSSSQILNQKMILTHGGNVGIGTGSPQNILHTDSASTGEVVGLALSNSNTSFSANESVSIKFGVGSSTALAHGKILVANTDSGFGSNSYMAFHTRGSDSVAERLRIDSSGNVGIGTNNPGTILQIGDGTTSEYITIDKSTTGESGILFKNAGNNKGKILLDSNENLQFYVNNTTNAMTILESGNVGIGESSPGSQLQITSNTAGVNSILTIKNAVNNRESRIQLIDESNQGGLVLNYDNGGNAAYIKNNVNGVLSIYLGGTGTANELDDYEEGTWTPACGATLSTATGKYTKIGNQVTVYYHLVTTGGLPSSTSQVIITGLPFTSNSGSLVAAPIYSRYYTPNDSSLTSLVQDSETQIRLMNINDQSFDYTIWGELEASANNSVYIIGSATYMV